ncbi:MAG: DNA topoisomerase 3 [Bacteroidaceae bacterium]|nr:DNA topoisomerase 3 [Bacteroidaceae bacterium]
MIVCIAEKPSAGRDIARILGANSKRDGYMEGNGYQVTWALGHLCELKYPEDYQPEWKRWSLGSLPMVPPRFQIRLKRDKGVEHQFAVVKRLIENADRIINCGDAGQEGELIQRWIMQLAGAKCPVERLWVSSLTDDAIREGFSTLRASADYDRLYMAGLCRAVGDWLLGMNATRLYTLKYGNNREKGAQPLSIGRVQTPTLALVVRRQQEIENFVPEPYWVLSTVYRDTTFTSTKKVKDEAEGQEAMAAIKDAPFEVTGVEKKKGTEAPPRLFDLTSLQVECNKKFGFTAETTLSLIQSLYEKKVATYPRVDTTYLPDDVYPTIPKICNGIYAHYKDVLDPLRGKPFRKSKKVFDNSKVTDHHAIIPTGVPPTNLTDVERKVYDLIARRFIANFYEDCKFSTTTVKGESAKVEFKVSGKEILEEGWRFVFAKKEATPEEPTEDKSDEKKDDAEERTLPTFAKGESGPHTPSLTQKFTTPPKPYTEATLLRAMETAGKLVDDEELRDAMKANGIGRPSTRAGIIETLKKRGYIKLYRKSLQATPTGVALIGIIREDLLKSAELTGLWEKKLRLIESGEYDAMQFVAELKQMVAGIVNQVLADNTSRM